MNCDGPFSSILHAEWEEQRMSFSLISNEVPIKAKEGTHKSHRTPLNPVLRGCQTSVLPNLLWKLISELQTVKQ